MGGITELPRSGERLSDDCPVIVSRYCKNPIFFSFHKYQNAMDKDFLLWNRAISHTWLFNNIVNDREPNLTTALWNNFYRLCGTKLSFSTAYHPQTDGLAEKVIETLE
ncbi:hypothetical protein O181_091450 [Austropuccinia psidii MF-1]|uniref:Integrase catalytic domain-containing protein n=1 Tax=Austropuccinia psidii MF-1 TaxID=1389203 RepID=A0A9Q3P856_9BASI|nr:hypothetical protein [Austropuccinia psidii MF-1]